MEFSRPTPLSCIALLGFLFAGLPLSAQKVCEAVPVYSPCEVEFELTEAEAARHPNPYATVEIRAEIRSPRHRTFLAYAYWDGGRRMVIRFAPTEAGQWDFRLSGNLERLQGHMSNITATAAGVPGFIRPANVHHFSYTENFIPHLWMGDTFDRFAFVDQAQFERIIDARAEQKFNHVRGLVLGRPEDSPAAVTGPDRIDPAHFQRLDQRIRYMNAKGIVADLVLGAGDNQLAKLFPTWRQRERYVRYLISRYAAFNITWQGVENFEEYENGRELLKEIGTLIKKLDPYQHPRSTGTVATSASLLNDGWMDHVIVNSPDDGLGSIEHQLYPVPFVNIGLASDASAGEFRRRLWNAAMNGQYVTLRGPDPDSVKARQMTVWYDFFTRTRHWDLEPYFDVDNGRAVALETIEYIIYAEKPGTVEALVAKHGYDVAWFNPSTGESIKQKEFKGEKFSGQTPDNERDWVLHLSREGKKEGMLKSYKFEARRILMQEVERVPSKIPFELAQPATDRISLAAASPFAVKVTRETRATRSMMWLWTGEVAADGRGYRVLGTGANGSFHVPPGIAKHFPAVLHVRLAGMNANGKIYSLDRTYQLTK
ncbi:MAG: DUF5060 domain-containing protein [Bryobacteraceae bacterium]